MKSSCMYPIDSRVQTFYLCEPLELQLVSSWTSTLLMRQSRIGHSLLWADRSEDSVISQIHM